MVKKVVKMTNIEFENKLDVLNFTKRDFVAVVGMPYQTLMNWKQKNAVPYWVEPFLNFYEKSRKFDEILEMLERFKNS